MRRVEVAQRGSLGEELGDREEARHVGDVAIAQESLAGSDRGRAPDDRDRPRLKRPDLGQDRLDGAHVGVASVVDRRADTDDDDLRGRAGGAVEDPQCTRRERRAERLLDARLAERDPAVPQLDQSRRVGLDQLDRVSQPREPDGTDQADIPGPDDRDGTGCRCPRTDHGPTVAGYVGIGAPTSRNARSAGAAATIGVPWPTVRVTT